MDMMRQGWSMSLFHASQQWSTMSSKDLKTRFESQFSRMNCQMFSCGLSSGHLAGNGMRVMLGGTFEPAREMPAGLIDEQRGVRARRDLGGDFGQVQVHRLGVASGHDEGCALAVLGADRAEDIGGGGSLIAGSAWAGAALGPPAGDLVLLADARLVGEPDLYGLGGDAVLARDLVQARREVLWNGPPLPPAP